MGQFASIREQRWTDPDTEGGFQAVVGEVPTKRSSDHDPMIRHCRIIGRFEP
jgi:hypothetical protein